MQTRKKIIICGGSKNSNSFWNFDQGGTRRWKQAVKLGTTYMRKQPHPYFLMKNYYKFSKTPLI